MMAAGIAAPLILSRCQRRPSLYLALPSPHPPAHSASLALRAIVGLGLRSLRARQCFLFEARLDELTLLRPVDALPEASFDFLFQKPIEFGEKLLPLNLRHERPRVPAFPHDPAPFALATAA